MPVSEQEKQFINWKQCHKFIQQNNEKVKQTSDTQEFPEEVEKLMNPKKWKLLKQIIERRKNQGSWNYNKTFKEEKNIFQWNSVKWLFFLQSCISESSTLKITETENNLSQWKEDFWTQSSNLMSLNQTKILNKNVTILKW
jgi:hypothetical protein